MNLRGLTLLLLLALASLLIGPGGCDKLVTEEITQNFYDTTLGEACLACHSTSGDLIARPKAQWANSKHFESADLIDVLVTLDTKQRSVSSCGPECHTNEGYINTFDNGNASTSRGYSGIGCFTCHQPHTGVYGSWNLNTLRALESFTQLEDGAVYRMGESNMCAYCHQARNGAPDTTIDVTLGADNFGPHYSPQADVLNETGGFFFSAPTITTSHKTVVADTRNGCLACHFGTGQGYNYGQHTFRLQNEDASNQFVTNCNSSGCHSGTRPNVTDFYAFASVDSMRVLAATIGDALKARGYLLSDGVSFTADSTVSHLDAKLLYNYLLYTLDGSEGIHSPSYMLQLLTQSAQQVNNLVPILNFATVDTFGCAPFTATFDASASRGENLTWSWSFGDGTPLGSDTIQQHTYDTAGTYTVRLILSGPVVADTLTLNSLVRVLDVPVASFETGDSIVPPNTDVVLTSTSLRADALNWIVTDTLGAVVKDTTTGESAVTFQFANPGRYSVSLIVANICGSDSTAQADLITVTTTLLGKLIGP